MRKIFTTSVFTILALLFFSASLPAQVADLAPSDVVLKAGDTQLASYKGVKARITNNKNEFLAFSFFISFDDVKDLAKKRKVECTYDAGAKKMKIGKENLDVIAPDPKSKDTFAFGKVRMVTYKGKPYFDFVGLWSGLGFNSYSKTDNGFSLKEAARK